MSGGAYSPHLLQEFCSETIEMVDQLEQGLLRLESASTDSSTLNAIFRFMHTVKGNCRMMGFSALEQLAHDAESLLDQLRLGLIFPSTEIASLLLRVVDAIRAHVAFIAHTGDEGTSDFGRLLEHLARLRGLETNPKPTPLPTTDDEGMFDWPEPEAEPDAELEFDPPEEDPFDLDFTPKPPPHGLAESPHEPTTVRLSMERLDLLMDKVGQVGALFNQLRYALHSKQELAEQALDGLETRIHDVQNEILQYRLQPIAQILAPYQRVVRDAAVSTNKQASFTTTGDETEVDRSILLAIKDALGHLLRNAVVHGIEPPEERRALGKPEVGAITLTASQRHGVILVELRDDGRGIDVEKVTQKAVSMGLLTLEQAAELPLRERLQLVLTPGLSTSATVNNIAGRGTGMDVVKSAIEKVGGSLEIDSQCGTGTSFRVRIPQTMAIVPVLLVTAGGETYGVPQTHVLEMYGFYGATEIASHCETKLGTPMVRARGGLVPLIRLNTLFNQAEPTKTEANILLIQAEEERFGLEVTTILNTTNLVVKPLPRGLSDTKIFSGTALLPDGKVAMLLNMVELFRTLHTDGHL